MKLKFTKEIPKDLTSVGPRELHGLLGGPTLMHLRGKKEEAIFLSTLLHGNETTSFLVLKMILEKYGENLPRDLIVFIGNTEAAVHGMRHLQGQADYNRIWEAGFTPEHQLAGEIIDYAKKQNIFASVDIHNNTGKNPNYGCINVLSEPFLDLVSHFGSHTVFFTEPHNVQSMAFSKFCTSMTIEAGLSGSRDGVEAAFNLIDRLLSMDKLGPSPERVNPEVHHTIARMMVNPTARIDFHNELTKHVDLSFVPHLDSNNFEVLPKNTHLGFARDLELIKVENDDGEDITTSFLKCENNKLSTIRTFIPSMFTKDIYVMKEDCLGYIMEVMIPTT